MPTVDDAARLLLDRMRRSGDVLALAESCTAGLISATLGRIPGASEVLAGSAVVYQVPTKTAWLNVPQSVIESQGVVSSDVAAEMTRSVLRKTPHATIAFAITGHLGPDAPAELDGIAWLAVARRNADVVIRRVKLNDVEPTDEKDGRGSLRIRRQQAAVAAALELLLECMA